MTSWKTSGTRLIEREDMKPLEAWRIISGCMNELANIRQSVYPQGKGYSQEEIEAQVMCFEALRKEEEGKI